MDTRLDKLKSYNGPSMNPTLQAGDSLITEPYNNEKVRPGDVVIFKPLGSVNNVVHRVVKADKHGIQTRGDNNNKVDIWIFTPDDIIGRVVSIKRNGRVLTIRGGVTGRFYGLFIRLYNMFRKKTGVILHPVYHYLADTGIFRRLVPLAKVRIQSFKRFNGTELQLVMGGKIIGRRLPHTDEWQIRRPYRLFIDKEELP